MARAKQIPAVGYLRKSTKGTKDDGRERQERSIPQQQEEIERLASNSRSDFAPAGYRIVRWYADPGISGWKRGAKRPGFEQMLNDARDFRDIKAILCDDIDRFSRAEHLEVQGDVRSLVDAGVQYIVTASRGAYDLLGDIGSILEFTVAAWMAHDFSRKLSRRIALARRNKARAGKQSGGSAPYGMRTHELSDKTFVLKHGDAREAKIVRRIYSEFVEHAKSMNSIAGQLNREGIASPRGGKWYVAAIKELLQRRAYRGDLEYNRRKSGRFHICNADGQIVKADSQSHRLAWKSTPAGVIVTEGTWKPLVDPALWDAAQERLTSFGMKGSRRPRENGYVLSRVLICDHCGKPLYGCHPKGRKHRVYRCSTQSKSGMGTCGSYEIREEDILPYVLKMLGEQLDNLEKLVSAPPQALRNPVGEQADRRGELEHELERLNQQIDLAEDTLLATKDARTRESLDAKISTKRDRLDELKAQLKAHVPAKPGYTKEQARALGEWWDQYFTQSVRMPIPPTVPLGVAAFYKPPLADLEDPDWQPEIMVDPRRVNEALFALGAEVRLRWQTSTVKLPSGKTRNRHLLDRGRFRLGQKSVNLPASFYKARAAGPCSGNRGADRCDNRKGRGSTPQSA